MQTDTLIQVLTDVTNKYGHGWVEFVDKPLTEKPLMRIDVAITPNLYRCVQIWREMTFGNAHYSIHVEPGCHT